MNKETHLMILDIEKPVELPKKKTMDFVSIL